MSESKIKNIWIPVVVLLFILCVVVAVLFGKSDEKEKQAEEGFPTQPVTKVPDIENDNSTTPKITAAPGNVIENPVATITSSITPTVAIVQTTSVPVEYLLKQIHFPLNTRSLGDEANVDELKVVTSRLFGFDVDSISSFAYEDKEGEGLFVTIMAEQEVYEMLFYYSGAELCITVIE